MPVLHQLQPSFNNGEISPLLYDRVDFQKFVSSVKSGKNMFVHPQGGMSNRAGTVMLAQAKDTNVRLIPFEFSSTETYVIEFGNGYCRFFTSNGQVIGDNNQPYEIISPFSVEDLDKIRYFQSGDVMYIAWGGKPKTLTRYGHADWVFADYNYKNGPIAFSEEKDGIVQKISGTLGFDYLMAKGDGNAYSSSDAQVWRVIDSPYSNIRHAQKVNDILFSVNSDGYLVYSTNGMAWAVLGNIRVSSLFQIFYIDGVYYLYPGYDASKFYTFSDFVNITTVNTPFYYVTKFQRQNGLFLAFAQETSSSLYYLYYSTDFSSWTRTTVQTNYDLFYVDGYYYAFGTENDANSCKKLNLSFEQISSISLPQYYSKGQVVDNKIYLFLHPANQATWVLLVFNPATSSTSVVSTQNGIGYFYFYGADGNYIGFNNGVLSSLNTNNDSISNIANTGGTAILNFIPFSVSYQGDSYTLSSTNYIFNQEDVYKKFRLEVKTPANSFSHRRKFSTGSFNGSSNSYFCGGKFLVITSGTWNGYVEIQYSKDDTNWDTFRKYSSSANANYEVPVDLGDFYFVRIVWSLSTMSGSDTDFSVSLNVYESTYPLGLKGAEYVSQTLIYVTPEEDSVDFINYVLNTTGKLFFSSWFHSSEKQQFPTDVELYQDRIVWSTNNQLDATKISNYNDFGVSTDVTEDDAISVIVKDKKVDKINSIIAGQKLAVYSDDGNFVHNNDTFTPNSSTFLKQGSTGGADVKPVVIREHIIYVHPMKQAISDYAYNFETDGYAGQDITLLANHLFDGKVIKTLAYQQEPYSIIWVLQEDGTVLACTYLRQQNVIAWTPMDFGGIVKSIAVCSHGTKEELYLAVQRANGTFVEKMPTRLLNPAPKECFFVDCGRTYRGEPATVISGLNYLEGEKVVALADGNVIKNLTVSNGSITLPIPASVVTVGLPYESVLETLTFDVNTGDGSHLNRKKRVVAVSIRYNNSRGSKVSVNGHKEIEMLRREQEGYNIPIALKSGVYRAILPSTHNESTHLKIKQDDPLPITIVSVIPEIEYEK